MSGAIGGPFFEPNTAYVFDEANKKLIQKKYTNFFFMILFLLNEYAYVTHPPFAGPNNLNCYSQFVAAKYQSSSGATCGPFNVKAS